MEALISKETESRLNQLQQSAYSKGIPILIIFEGSSGRVIGRVINEIMRCLEPRGVEYRHFDPKSINDPWSVMGFLRHTPAKARITLYDRSWYSAIIDRSDDNKKELERMLALANGFESYLVNNGTFLIKILLRSTESSIKEYDSQYGPKDPKKSFLSMDHIDATEYREVILDLLNEAGSQNCPWDKIEAGGVKDTVAKATAAIIKRLENRLKEEPDKIDVWSDYKFSNPRGNADLCKTCDSYKKKIGDLSDELANLQLKLAESKRSLIVGFEGWDAAGKGSAIKHLCHALNPRGYSVNPIKAPTQEELDHTYLWRFSTTVPEKGHISIYDRTWYGRMLVEPIEGFCSVDEYSRAPVEINEFEKVLTDNEAIVIKFWMEVSQDEQLKRFEDRMADPLKQWKITDDDWRNRAKWDDYCERIDHVMKTTNTPYAPWTVVESNDKKYARVKVLQTVVDRLKKALD